MKRIQWRDYSRSSQAVAPGRAPCAPGGARYTDARSLSARSVASQVNSGSSRPKWP
jgi:hypothetical protein